MPARLRTLGWPLLGAAVLVLSLPAAVGWVAERETARLADAFAARQPGVALVERAFDRGWWRSQGRQVLRVDPARLLPPALAADLAGLSPVLLQLDSVYRHGPLPRGMGRTGRAQVETRIFLVGNGDRLLLGEAVTDLALGGDGEARLSLAPVAMDFAGRYGGLDWSGGVLKLTFAAAFDRLEVSGELNPLQLRTEEGSLTVGPGRLALALERGEGLWLGAGTLEVVRADAWTRRAPRSRTLASDLRLRAESLLAEGGAVLAAAVELARVSVLGRESSDLGISVRASELEPAALRRLGRLWQEAVLLQLGREETLARLEDIGRQLLAAGLVLEFDSLRAQLHYGPLDGRMSLRLPADSVGLAALDHPRTEILARWQVPDGLVTLAREQPSLQAPLELLLQSGALRPQPGGWSLDLQYRNRLLVINGLPLTLPFTVLRDPAG